MKKYIFLFMTIGITLAVHAEVSEPKFESDEFEAFVRKTQQPTEKAAQHIRAAQQQIEAARDELDKVCEGKDISTRHRKFLKELTSCIVMKKYKVDSQYRSCDDFFNQIQQVQGGLDLLKNIDIVIFPAHANDQK